MSVWLSSSLLIIKQKGLVIKCLNWVEEASAQASKMTTITYKIHLKLFLHIFIAILWIMLHKLNTLEPIMSIHWHKSASIQ